MHGSAPDTAWSGVANPIAQLWSRALMLDFLGHRDTHDAIARLIETVLGPANGGPRTPDLGGRASTAARSPLRSENGSIEALAP